MVIGGKTQGRAIKQHAPRRRARGVEVACEGLTGQRLVLELDPDPVQSPVGSAGYAPDHAPRPLAAGEGHPARDALP